MRTALQNCFYINLYLMNIAQTQPAIQLGNEFDLILDSRESFARNFTDIGELQGLDWGENLTDIDKLLGFDPQTKSANRRLGGR